MKKEVVLITGGGQRVGLYLAEQLLAQGYEVCVTYRTPRDAIQALQEKGALTFQVDFLQADSVTSLMSFLKQHVCSLRAVIHSASVWHTDNEVSQQPDLFDAMLKLHVQLPLSLTNACAELLKQSEGRADVVAISDASALVGSPKYAAYLASKAGLNSLVQSLAKKYAPDFKVNQLSPGLVMFHESDDEAYRQKRLDQTAFYQAPSAEMIWQAIQYLLSAEHATGANIELNHLKRPFN